jgi:hypothetical protein
VGGSRVDGCTQALSHAGEYANETNVTDCPRDDLTTRVPHILELHNDISQFWHIPVQGPEVHHPRALPSIRLHAYPTTRTTHEQIE